jgi:nucleoside-diphosphate-sugar epimerase
MKKILIIGAGGQIGTELTETLREREGAANVVATDIRPNEKLSATGPFEILDVEDAAGIAAIIDKYQINTIYLLAALLSATGEQNPALAWRLNMNGLLNVLELMREKKLERLFWPSSIAVFGPTTPRHNTPQDTLMEPHTVYGISKLAGELWCNWYWKKYGVDVRSIRYPGLIGYKSPPGGGTTDYAVDIYHKALLEGSFSCFLPEDSALPMMYMPDALRATIELMEAPAEQVKIRTSYNLGGVSFAPKEIAASIQKELPSFKISYNPDPLRKAIADSWPASIDDSRAQADWGWKQEFDLQSMTSDMLLNLKKIYQLA